MKVLFVPNRIGYISHGVPLIALSRLLSDRGISSAFLVSAQAAEFFRLAGVNVLAIGHEGLRTEMVAYHQYRPDVVVDDMSITTAIASPMTGVPRVTLLRTGLFAGSSPRNPLHRHSGEFDLDSMSVVAALGMPRPTDLQALSQAEAVIVPGMRSVELLPAMLAETGQYFFSGPLLIDDFLYRGRDGTLTNPDAVERFLAANAGERIVYVSFGNIAAPTAPVRRVIHALLHRGLTIISNIDISADGPVPDRYLFGSYLPMHRICSRAALMIHHCGSGTYHYPILHSIPAVTIGTRCYDRDDVAVRLQELGASFHVPAPEECADFEDQLLGSSLRLLDANDPALHRAKAAVAALRREAQETSLAFNFEQAAAVAIERSRRRDSATRRPASAQPPSQRGPAPPQ